MVKICFTRSTCNLPIEKLIAEKLTIIDLNMLNISKMSRFKMIENQQHRTIIIPIILGFLFAMDEF